MRSLEAPGVPIQFSYTTPAGKITLSADAYSIDFDQGVVALHKIKLVDPHGSNIASLDSLTAKGLRPIYGANQSLWIEGSHLKATLVRKKSGQFQIEDLLPKQKGPPSQTPFDVHVNECQIQYIDESGGDQWQHMIRIPTLDVAGTGTSWIARGTAVIPDVGTIDSRVEHSSSDRLSITGSCASAQLSSIIGHFKRTPELSSWKSLSDLSVGSLTTSGPFKLVIEPKKPILFWANSNLAADHVQLGDKSVDRIQFQGQIQQDGIAGKVTTSTGAVQAKFNGSMSWNHTQKWGGSLTVDNVQSNGLPLWIKRLLPQDLGFDNTGFTGWIGGKDLKHFRATGDVRCTRLTFRDQSATALSLQVDVDQDHVATHLVSGRYQGQPASGNLNLNLHSKSINGTLRADKTDLNKICSRFGLNSVTGNATIQAELTGTLSDPKLDLSTNGQAVFSFDKKRSVELGHFEGFATYRSGTLQIEHAFADSPDGLISARGALSQREISSLEIAIRGMQAGAWLSDVTGTVNLAGTLSGSFQKPHFDGRLEGFDIGYHDQLLPAFVANIEAEPKRVVLNSIEAAKGTASMTGSAEIRFPGNRISGSLSARDIQIADWAGEPYLGSIDVPSIQLGGTLSNPNIAAAVNGTSILIKGVKIDSLSGILSYDGNQLSADNFELAGADGKVTASGTYQVAEHRGRVTVQANRLSVEKLVPEVSDTISLLGTISGTGTADFEKDHLSHANLSGDLTSITANGSPLGSGPWQIQADGDHYTGSLEIGDLQRFITFDNLTYNPATQVASGDVSLFNVRAENIVSAMMRYLPNLTQDTKDRLSALKSDVNLAANFDGTFADPNIRVSSLQAANIKYHNDPIGEIDSAFVIHKHRWDIQSFAINQGPISLSLTGSVEENGAIHIDGSNENRVNLSKLGAFDPKWGAVTGDAQFWFNVDGETKSPHVVASLKVNNLLAPPGTSIVNQNEDKNLRFNLDKLELKPTEENEATLEAEGEYFYKGFRGAISLISPFEYPFKIPNTGDLRGKLTLEESSLKEIAPLLGGIDPLKTSGKVRGDIEIGGMPSDIKIAASAELKADSLAVTGVTDILKNLSASAKLISNQLTVTTQGESSRGGSFKTNVSTPVEDLEDLIAIYQKSGVNGLLDRTLDGKASFDHLQFKQSLFTDSTGGGIVSGDLNLTGRLVAPTIKGNIAVANGEFAFKGIQPSTQSQAEFSINPRFGIDVSLSSPAHLQSSTANLYLLGTGSLNGSLQYPRLNSSLYVDKGTVRLPAALLRIDQGGTVQVNYQNTRVGSTASVNVDLEGTTSVTTTRASESDIQRYQILLGMKGDLLDANGLNLTASSDPPDLSQDRILGILGQTDFLQSISTGFKQSEAVGAVAQFVVPTLLDPLTSELAKGFGLDYLNIEYNLFDQASLAFGKDIGKGFSVIGSRQLSEPPPGFLTRFDVRLMFRPRRVPGALRQIRFFFGADQDRAWKVGLDYGIRF